MCTRRFFYLASSRYSDYIRICSRIRRTIRQDQIEGGMAGIYNPSITQRLNSGATLVMAFSAGGWSTSDIVIFGCFLVGAPWTVMGMWNAVIGIWLLHGRKHGLDKVAPHLRAMAQHPRAMDPVAMATRRGAPACPRPRTRTARPAGSPSARLQTPRCAAR